METVTKLTDLERTALKNISEGDELGDDENTYWYFTAEDLGLPLNVAKGVMGSLEKKFIISDSEHRGDGGCIVWVVEEHRLKELGVL